MLTVGLTGSIGTGKSTVARMFEECGAKVLDADKIARRMLYKSSPCFSDVVREFGKGILTQGRINRRKLAAIVFNNPTELKKLERIIHPQVRKTIVDKLQKFRQRLQYRIVIIEVPLLFEVGFDKIVDYTVVVKARRDQQIKRAKIQLKITEAEVRKRIEVQMPLSKKIRLADIIIDNSRTKTLTKKQVNKIWQKLSQEKIK